MKDEDYNKQFTTPRWKGWAKIILVLILAGLFAYVVDEVLGVNIDDCPQGEIC